MRVVLDLDDTIINSTNTVLNIYNYIHNTNIQYHNNFDWGFKGLIPNPNIEELLSYFESELFYDDRFIVMEPEAINVINKIAIDNEVIICSNQKEKRAKLTSKWIKDTFYNNVSFKAVESFDKSSVGYCDIFLDDKIEALESVKNIAEVRICYKDYLWNKEWGGDRIHSWINILELCKN